MLAMLPAPNARAGRAKISRKANPRRLEYSFEEAIVVDLTGCCYANLILSVDDFLSMNSVKLS
jgi:hypothetical protein